jgi:hypothetical protein
MLSVLAFIVWYLLFGVVLLLALWAGLLLGCKAYQARKGRYVSGAEAWGYRGATISVAVVFLCGWVVTFGWFAPFAEGLAAR